MTGPASDARGPKPDGEAGSSRRDTPDWRVALPETRRRHLRAWLWAVAGTTFLVLVVGGITRLTQSGLSIVEWKPIAGVVPPMDEAAWQEVFDRYRRSPEYRQVRAGMSLADFKVIFFWEYLHRIVARLIGLVFVVPFAVFWRVVGTLLLGATLGLFVLVRRRVADVVSRRLNAAVAASMTVQYALGVLTLLYYVPVSLGVLHQAAAMIIAGVWIAWVHHVRQLGLAPATHDEHGPVSAAGAGRAA